MKTSQNSFIITLAAGEALTKKRFVDATGKHTADVPAIGATTDDVDSGNRASIDTGPVIVVEAAGVITVGTHHFVKSDANGKAVAHSISGHADFVKVAGTPLDTSAADGDMIRVRL